MDLRAKASLAAQDLVGVEVIRQISLEAPNVRYQTRLTATDAVRKIADSPTKKHNLATQKRPKESSRGFAYSSRSTSALRNVPVFDPLGSRASARSSSMISFEHRHPIIERRRRPQSGHGTKLCPSADRQHSEWRRPAAALNQRPKCRPVSAQPPVTSPPGWITNTGSTPDWCRSPPAR